MARVAKSGGGCVEDDFEKGVRLHLVLAFFCRYQKRVLVRRQCIYKVQESIGL